MSEVLSKRLTAEFSRRSTIAATTLCLGSDNNFYFKRDSFINLSAVETFRDIVQRKWINVTILSLLLPNAA